MRLAPALARRTIGATLLGASALALPLRAQVGTCAPARTALVLAGGGSKGLTHLGVLRALDSLGIVPDLVVGTSMGAVIGALYASGESAEQIAARIRQTPLDRMIRDYEPIVSASLGGLRPALVWEREPAHWVLQTGAMREAEVSATLSRLALRANLLARGDFDRLPIPFRAVATDLDSRSVVPIGRGDLALALRASMSIPLLLRPVVLDGRTLVDGGLSSNVPVGVARAMGAERVIVSTIASPKPDPAAFDDPLTVTSQLFEFLWVQDSVRPREGDVVIAQPTAPYGMLDFRPAMLDSLVRVGERTSAAAFAQASCVRPLAPARAGGPAQARSAPATTIGRVTTPTEVGGGALIAADLGLTPGAPLDQALLREGLARVAVQERYRGVWLTPSGDSARTDFDLRVDPAPARTFGLGFAFDHTMSGRLWVAMVDRALLGRDLEASALLTTGTWRTDLTLAARRRAPVGGRILPVGAMVQGLTEQVRLWNGPTELPHVNAEEASVVLGLRPLFDPGWSYEFGLDWRAWQVRGLEALGSVGARAAVRYRLPASPQPTVSVEAVALEAWQRVAVDLSHTQRIGALEVRPRVRAGFGHDVPLHQTFTLGGPDGFAGLRLLEQRGDRELFGSLLLRWPLWRMLAARVEPMVGMTGVGDLFSGPGPLDGVLLVGVRAGVDIGTPFGPIRIEEGFNNQDRRQALIRFGYWF